MHPAPLRRLPSVELQVMERDGEIIGFGHDSAREYRSIADEIDAHDRARSLAPLLPRRCCVAGASAIWVHAGGRAPASVTIATPHGKRKPVRARLGVRLRATAPLAHQVVLVGNVPVLTREAALIELLHDPGAPEHEVIEAIRVLELDPRSVLGPSSVSRRPYAHLARRRAELAPPQPGGAAPSTGS